MKTESPIACKLTEPVLQERRSTVLQKVGQSVLEVRELENGFAYRFPIDDEWLFDLTELIRFERHCCPFLTFKMIVESNDGAVWLELTGSPEAKDFIGSLSAGAMPRSLLR